MDRKTTSLLLLITLVIFFAISSTESRKIIEDESGTSADAALYLGPGEGTPVLEGSSFGSCDIARDDCGSITPHPSSGYIADGAYNAIDETIFFVSVPGTAEGVFQFDPLTCTIVSGTFYSINSGLSQRGIAFDPSRYQFWAGGWIDYYMNQHDAAPPYPNISYNYVGIAIASGAIDPANDYLFIGTNSSYDMVYAYDISTGSLGELLGSWIVPWQQGWDGWDMAGMAFDDDSGQLLIVNQYLGGPGEAMEEFDFDIETGLTPAGFCTLDNTTYAWGIGLIEDGDPAPGTFSAFVTDVWPLYDPPFDIDEYGEPDVDPPYELVCTIAGFGVELTWINGEEYDEVNISRDGDLVAILPGDAAYYLDAGPGAGFHTYSVVGETVQGESPETTCDVLVYPGPKQTCFDFELLDGGWAPGGVADWEWGWPSYQLDGKAWETNIGERYFNDSCGWLDSPPFQLGPSGGWLVFDVYTYVECYWDGWNVQISTDGGTQWSVIEPLHGYNQGVPEGACREGLGGDTSCGYREVETWEFDLSDYPDETIRIRFLIESDQSIAYTGVIIDNLCVYGIAGPERYHKEAVPGL